MKSIVVLLTLLCRCHCQSKKKQTKPKDDGCPKGWKRHDDRCYYFSENLDTFENANKFCKDANSQLVPPIVCEEQAALDRVLIEYRKKLGKGPRFDEFWIGILQNSSVGKWQTTKGYTISQNRHCQHWSKGFPKLTEGNCVNMIYGIFRPNRGYWMNSNCTRTLKYVCITCPNTFDFIPEINECLFFNPIKANWSVAQKTCSLYKRRSQMVTIEDGLKHDAVKRYLEPLVTKHLKTCEHAKALIVWIGAQTSNPTACGTPHVWKPAPGVTLPLYYSNWFPGTPNCGAKDENCICVIADSRYSCRWEDVPCSFRLCYVCEFD